ncbi:hypothetical protein O9993_01115 [Vibrio lentus]|nr:hypothetical protein [Vibrio lentus]
MAQRHVTFFCLSSTANVLRVIAHSDDWHRPLPCQLQGLKPPHAICRIGPKILHFRQKPAVYRFSGIISMEKWITVNVLSV